MANKKTPLLLKLRKNSGTVYVFPSASEDVGLNLNADINGASITHFALLNIPSFKVEDFLFNKDLYFDLFNKEDTACFIPALSLQNYMMNMETVMLNSDTYNFQDLETISEKCFWHWLIATKTIQVDDPKKWEKIEYNGETYYYEPDRTNNIVKCFGDIDAGNSVTTEFGVFNETYINIPSSYGGGPVFFKKRPTSNYPVGTFTAQSSQFLEGRTSMTEYVSYSGNNDKPIGDNGQSADIVYNTTNECDCLEIVKDIDTINILLSLITDSKLTNPVISYDDINIDARRHLMKNKETLVSQAFDFNAILLYYSIYDANDSIKAPYATNLFGIIFVDGVTLDTPLPDAEHPNSTPEAVPIIKGMHKRQTTDDDFGTSYSFRVNVKTMSIYDDTNALILDNTTMSSMVAQDFSGAISQLNRAVNIMETNMQTTSYIQDAYALVMSYYNKQATDLLDISTHLLDLINGRINKISTLDSLYCNKYYNILGNNDSPYDSSLSFYLLHPETDEYGKLTYVTDDEPYAFMIDHNGLHSHTISTGVSYHQKEYRVMARGAEDYPIWINDNNLRSALDQSNQINSRLDVAREMLEQMFETSTNLRIKLYYDPNNTIAYSNALSGNPILNYLYIDEASPVFDASSGTKNIAYLKDTSTGFIDYAAFVPYIIALLQHINEKFAYTYDLHNTIYGIDDIKSIKDAIDYMLNIFHYDDMENYKAEFEVHVYNAIYDYDTGLYTQGIEITQTDENGQVYFYKGSPVIVRFNWVAAEPNNDMLSNVDLVIPNNSAATGESLYENLIDEKFSEAGLAALGGKWESPIIDYSGSKYIIDKHFDASTNKELNPSHDITEYSGTYYILNPGESLTSSITLKSNIQSESIRNLMDKTLTVSAKCMVKCFYWTGSNGTIDFGNTALSDIDIYVENSDIEYNAKDLELNSVLVHNLKYFNFEDRGTRLLETPLQPVFKKILNDTETDVVAFDDMYVYFLLPYYEDINYSNIHVYASFDAGVGGYEVYPHHILVNDNNITTAYRLYRTSQKQNGFINIKIG